MVLRFFLLLLDETEDVRVLLCDVQLLAQTEATQLVHELLGLLVGLAVSEQLLEHFFFGELELLRDELQVFAQFVSVCLREQLGDVGEALFLQALGVQHADVHNLAVQIEYLLSLSRWQDLLQVRLDFIVCAAEFVAIRQDFGGFVELLGDVQLSVDGDDGLYVSAQQREQMGVKILGIDEHHVFQRRDLDLVSDGHVVAHQGLHARKSVQDVGTELWSECFLSYSLLELRQLRYFFVKLTLVQQIQLLYLDRHVFDFCFL